ncbi:MAG: HNH endonuclease [Planctomycetes bacterium]|nr:HNH endonuclease [Planctomycetota bacterium]
MHASIKKAMGYGINVSEKEIVPDWKKRTGELCKPCWELNYCPFGPMVEEFPLLPVILSEAKEHNAYLKEILKAGKFRTGEKIDALRKAFLRKEVKNFKPKSYPSSIPKTLLEASCKVYGHICPVFFTAEPLTETKKRRKHSRNIPRDVMLKVVRRDGQICQECNSPVPDNDVEFDHIIPFSKGGRSVVSNLRLIHKGCNRRKSASLKNVLSDNPIEHLWELRKKRKNKAV